MKKLIITFFLFVSLIGTASAPPNVSLMIPMATPLTYRPWVGPVDGGTYEPLMEAIYTYESTRDTTAHNLKEGAVGGFQIRQCRLDDYNRLNDTCYQLEDCHGLNLSRQIFLYFTNHDYSGHLISNKSWEQAAKNWNGSGRATEIYWENVKKLIQ